MGRFSKPFVTGPNPILLYYSREREMETGLFKRERDGDSQEVVAEPERKKGMDSAIAIGGPGAAGDPSACGGR
jgi:hypothetical protein